MGEFSETVKLSQALRKIVRQEIDEQTKSCFRLYKAQVISAPNGSTCTVQLVGDDNLMELPYATAVDGVSVGDLVWVATIFNSFSNAIVFNSVNFKTAYKIDDLYISTNPTSPVILFGGVWEQLPANKVLEIVSTSSTAGQTIAAGLPNIKGELGTGGSSALFYSVQTKGAFTNGDSGKNYGASGTSSTADRTSWMLFSAANGEVHNGAYRNDVYGKSDTVQPPAYTIYGWKKVG